MKESNKLAAACCNLYISNVILLKYYIIVILKVNFFNNMRMALYVF